MPAHNHAEHGEAARPEAVVAQSIVSYKDFGRGLQVVEAMIAMQGSDKPVPWTFFGSNPYVSALIWGWKENRIYVLLARAVKAAAGLLWDPCEGGIAAGRDARQSIKKEIADEMGITLTQLRHCKLVSIGNFFQQTDRQLEEPVHAGHQPVPKRARSFLAEVESELIATDTSQGQRLDDEEIIRPVWMLLDEAIAEVEKAAKGENADGDLGASPVLLMMLYRLWRMQQQGKTEP